MVCSAGVGMWLQDDALGRCVFVSPAHLLHHVGRVTLLHQINMINCPAAASTETNCCCIIFTPLSDIVSARRVESE